MRKRRYLAEACRTLGTALVLGSFFKEDDPTTSTFAFVGGVALIVIGWLFAETDE